MLIKQSSVFNCLRTLTTRHCPARILTPLLQQSIDISACRAHSSKPTTAGLLLCAHAGTERRTDTVQFDRPCSAHYAGSANNVGDTHPCGSR